MLTSSDLKTAKLSIGTIESDAVNKIDLKAKAVAGPKLTINYTGITADDLNNVADDLGGLLVLRKVLILVLQLRLM